MLPDIDLRLSNTIKALSDVVLPALPAGEALAREQAQLAIAHLGLVQQQWKAALAFESNSLAAACRLADALLALLRGDPQGAPLLAARAHAAAVNRFDYGAVERAHRELLAALAGIVADYRSEEPLPAALLDAVLAYGEAQARRERRWFAACGLDPDRDQLPPLPEVER
jgi:hypothetical protein